MERTALARPRVQPSPRAARKSEWLRSALAHHHCPDPGAENEVVVLATGIDQYLQEVFHHLTYSNRNDTMSAEDFSALCSVLGLTEKRKRATKGGTGDGQNDEEDEEFGDVCSGLPGQISFKDFHSRLCGYFRVRSARRGAGECAGRLPVTEDTELVERQIRVRWPRVRRRKCVSFDLTRDQSGAGNRSIKARAAEEREPGTVTARWLFLVSLHVMSPVFKCPLLLLLHQRQLNALYRNIFNNICIHLNIVAHTIRMYWIEIHRAVVIL